MWKTIIIYETQFKAKTDKAVLIAMPKNSDYGGYAFWHSAKLIRRRGGMYTFSYTDEFLFKLIKNGKGRYNQFSVIDEVRIPPEVMENAFENQQNVFN